MWSHGINATKFNAFQKVKVVNVEVSRHILSFFVVVVNDLHDFMWAHQLFSRFTHFFSLLLFIFFVGLFSSELLFHLFCSRWQIHQWLFFQQDTLCEPLPYSPEMIVRSNIIRLKSFSGCRFLFALVCYSAWACAIEYDCVSIFVCFCLSLCVWLVIFVLRIFLHSCCKDTFLPDEIVSLEPFQKFNWMPSYTHVYTSTVKASWEYSSASQEIPPKSVYLYIYLR